MEILVPDIEKRGPVHSLNAQVVSPRNVTSTTLSVRESRSNKRRDGERTEVPFLRLLKSSVSPPGTDREEMIISRHDRVVLEFLISEYPSEPV